MMWVDYTINSIPGGKGFKIPWRLGWRSYGQTKRW